MYQFQNYKYLSEVLFVAAHYQWFWTLIDNNCNTNELSQTLCNRCDDYSVTACYADETTCDASGGTDGPTCPYTICRQQILNYLSNNLLLFTVKWTTSGQLNTCAISYSSGCPKHSQTFDQPNLNIDLEHCEAMPFQNVHVMYRS